MIYDIDVQARLAKPFKDPIQICVQCPFILLSWLMTSLLPNIGLNRTLGTAFRYGIHPVISSFSCHGDAIGARFVVFVLKLFARGKRIGGA